MPRTATMQPQEVCSDLFLTERDLAALLSVKRQTLAAWRCRGGGPPFTRVGAAIRYQRIALATWLAGRTGTSNAQLDTAVSRKTRPQRIPAGYAVKAGMR
jgi:hypothetical protein